MKFYAFLAFLLFAQPSGLPAQLISFGVQGGVPLLSPTQNNDESRRYVVGPSVEVRLPANFAIEVDALYQRIGNTYRFGPFGPITGSFTGTAITSEVSRFRGNAWEFPVLGKYYFHARSEGLQPFVDTGFAIRTIGFQSKLSETTQDANGLQHSLFSQNDYRSDIGVGAVVGAGVRLRAGRFAILPEIRYTRWGQSSSLPRKDEAQFLLGLRF